MNKHPEHYPEPTDKPKPKHPEIEPRPDVIPSTEPVTADKKVEEPPSGVVT